jgi:hypothetical protein
MAEVVEAAAGSVSDCCNFDLSNSWHLHLRKLLKRMRLHQAARAGWSPALQALNQHSRHQPQSSGLDFAEMGERRTAEGQSEGRGSSDGLESVAIS